MAEFKYVRFEDSVLPSKGLLGFALNQDFKKNPTQKNYDRYVAHQIQECERAAVEFNYWDERLHNLDQAALTAWEAIKNRNQWALVHAATSLGEAIALMNVPVGVNEVIEASKLAASKEQARMRGLNGIKDLKKKMKKLTIQIAKKLVPKLLADDKGKSLRLYEIANVVESELSGYIAETHGTESAHYKAVPTPDTIVRYIRGTVIPEGHYTRRRGRH